MIVIADLHIGRVNDSVMIDGTPSQMVDVLRRLTTITARAKMTKQCVVVAGDVFNTVNPTSRSLSLLFTWLNDCRRSGVNVYIIAGNHDAGVDWTSSTMLNSANLPNVIVVTSLQYVDVEERGITRSVLFFSHLPMQMQDRATQGHGSVSRWASGMFSKAELVISHGMIKSHDYSNDIFFEAGNAMVVEPAEFKNLKLMVLGHVHDHTRGDLWVYPGSLTINNFGELEERKGWVEVDLKDLSYEWHEFPDDVTPWVHAEIDLTDKDERSLDEDSVKELVEGAIVKVTVLTKSHGVVDEAYLRQLFGRWAHVSRFETKVVGGDAREALPEPARLSHSEILKEYLDDSDTLPGEKKAAYKLGSEIITQVMGGSDD